jgi:hypothetical protein
MAVLLIAQSAVLRERHEGRNCQAACICCSVRLQARFRPAVKLREL